MEKNEVQCAAPKCQNIFQYFYDKIVSGEYKPGDRLPGEHQIAKIFQVSRPTVGRALLELKKARLVDRQVGSGTYVLNSPVAESAKSPRVPTERRLGLLVPGLGQGEIFEPICNQITLAVQENGFSIYVGDANSLRNVDNKRLASATEELCRQYVEQKVQGVVFQPIELSSGMEDANKRILSLLEKANIPVVLIDADAVPFPERSQFDLVGIDNRRVGAVLARHLVERGAKRIHFVAKSGAANTVATRVFGFLEQMFALTGRWESDAVHRVENFETEIPAIVRERRPDAFICGNDHTAARVIQVLTRLKLRIPDDVRVVGVDDLRYAKLLSVPLTTVAQPCSEIGAQAARLLVERIENPELPVRDLLLDFKLVVRESSGSAYR